jgi:4a-hydroxytetrahydrobiopterin dehydratase
MKRLELEEIELRLGYLKEWTGNTEFIQREVQFRDFKTALAKMVEIGFIAEKLNHHPDWTNVYNRLSIKLTTHDAGGVTLNDFEMAREIEALLS